MKDFDETYILSIDQSTSGTKAMLFDRDGNMAFRQDIPHRQIVVGAGFLEHDPEEIYQNMLEAVRRVVGVSGIAKGRILCAAISNQRETVVMWDKNSGRPVHNAIVWQCARAKEICAREAITAHAGMIAEVTGLPLSPYFSGAKVCWLLENRDSWSRPCPTEDLLCGNMDSWLIFQLSGGRVHKTDYSNASRTQLFDLKNLCWSEQICRIFGIDMTMLPAVCCSDSLFCSSDFNGFFDQPIQIHGVLGDSHGALFGQGCLKPGQVKATLGTGSSVMMNTGTQPVFSKNGISSSIAWGADSGIHYVLEGNINYAGAVTSWLKDKLRLIASAKEAGQIAAGQENGGVYMVPAFSGMGAPYWNNDAKGVICGLTQNSSAEQIIRAGEECIAYQIRDIISAMEEDAGQRLTLLRCDGGPANDRFLMQFLADILNTPVAASRIEELSGAGAAYMAGLAMGLYTRDRLFAKSAAISYTPKMEEAKRTALCEGWKAAVKMTLSGTNSNSIKH